YHSLAVSRADASTNTPHQSLGPLYSESLFAAEKISERNSFHKLHHNKRRRIVAPRFTKVVNRDDVRMVQHRCCACFTTKPRHRCIIPDEFVVQDLYCDFVTDVNA